jgi:hypothetical protein
MCSYWRSRLAFQVRCGISHLRLAAKHRSALGTAGPCLLPVRLGF